jgi:hypothetical protein
MPTVFTLSASPVGMAATQPARTSTADKVAGSANNAVVRNEHLRSASARVIAARGCPSSEPLRLGPLRNLCGDREGETCTPDRQGNRELPDSQHAAVAALAGVKTCC